MKTFEQFANGGDAFSLMRYLNLKLGGEYFKIMKNGEYIEYIIEERNGPYEYFNINKFGLKSLNNELNVWFENHDELINGFYPEDHAYIISKTGEIIKNFDQEEYESFIDSEDLGLI